MLCSCCLSLKTVCAMVLCPQLLFDLLHLKLYFALFVGLRRGTPLKLCHYHLRCQNYLSKLWFLEFKYNPNLHEWIRKSLISCSWFFKKHKPEGPVLAKEYPKLSPAIGRQCCMVWKLQNNAMASPIQKHWIRANWCNKIKASLNIITHYSVTSYINAKEHNIKQSYQLKLTQIRNIKYPEADIDYIPNLFSLIESHKTIC